MYGTAKAEARAFLQLEAKAKAKARLFFKSGFGFLPMSGCITFLGKWYMIYRSYTKIQKENSVHFPNLRRHVPVDIVTSEHSPVQPLPYGRNSILQCSER